MKKEKGRDRVLGGEREREKANANMDQCKGKIKKIPFLLCIRIFKLKSYEKKYIYLETKHQQKSRSDKLAQERSTQPWK